MRVAWWPLGLLRRRRGDAGALGALILRHREMQSQAGQAFLRSKSRKPLATTTTRNTMETNPSAQNTVTTYHCICSTLILATHHKLQDLPRRSAPAVDGASIVPLGHDQPTQLHNIDTDAKPIVIRKEDGFEKRHILRCNRCRLTLGYQLATDAQKEDVAYILPGGLQTTEDMKEGRSFEQPAWALQET
jgi:hypothetical protein